MHVEHPLYPVSQSREEGTLKVSSLHTLHYALYGNPQGMPVIVLHGGPGYGCTDSISRFFDPERWNVVMFDQRGAMRSQPLGCMEENSTQHSIQDIETLRKHLHIDRWFVFGGSWGSTLALLYGQEFPERCLGFILRGIFLARRADYLHLFQGMGKIFPEAYERLVQAIPEEERRDLFEAYYRRIFDSNPEIQRQAMREFMLYDTICATHLPQPEMIEAIQRNDSIAFSTSKAFFHYCKHDFFIEPNQILSRMDRISHLPSIIVHGRWDAICLPDMAFSLHRTWNNSLLWMIDDGGHSSNDPAIAQALATATDQLLH